MYHLIFPFTSRVINISRVLTLGMCLGIMNEIRWCSDWNACYLSTVALRSWNNVSYNVNQRLIFKETLTKTMHGGNIKTHIFSHWKCNSNLYNILYYKMTLHDYSCLIKPSVQNKTLYISRLQHIKVLTYSQIKTTQWDLTRATLNVGIYDAMNVYRRGETYSPPLNTTTLKHHTEHHNEVNGFTVTDRKQQQ